MPVCASACVSVCVCVDVVCVQQCLEYLLGTAPKRLYGAFPDTYRNFTAASRAASTLSREYQKALAAWE